MQNSSSQAFNFPIPIKLAWLLRKDVRGQADVDDPSAQKDFLAWWALFGAKEYQRSLELDESSKQILFEPIADWPSQLPFKWCRLSKQLTLIRKDIAAPADTNDVQAWLAWTSWFFIYGLQEHKLTHLVDDTTKKLLNQPSFLIADNNASTTAMQINWLMHFVWLLRHDIKNTININIPAGREQLARWFWSGGCVELGLTSLVSTELRHVLCQSITIGDRHTKIPFVAYLLWQARDDIRAAFNLAVITDQDRFETWVVGALKEEPALIWLADDIQFPKPIVAAPKRGVNLIGFAYGELGIGEDVRMAAAACDAVGIPYDVISIAPGAEVRQADYSVADKVKEQGSYPVNIFCLTGFDTAHLWLKREAELFAGRYNIGWWPWELPVWPGHWQCAFDFVDEVWAATEFTHKMYRAATDKPVHLMPLPVKLPANPARNRAQFRLPPDKFLYLYIFDFNSYLARKNPFAVVNAFIKAFPKNDQHVGLVLKTMNSRQDNPQWLKFCADCAKDERIILIEQTLDRMDVISLLASCDAYVSLHRSEGFGRTLAEAMLLGKPVVATDFSGNVDFLTTETGFPVRWKKKGVAPGDYPFVEPDDNAYWAEPSAADAVKQLQAARQAAKDDEFVAGIIKFAEQQFAVARIGELMKIRLKQLMQTL